MCHIWSYSLPLFVFLWSPKLTFHLLSTTRPADCRAMQRNSTDGGWNAANCCTRSRINSTGKKKNWCNCKVKSWWRICNAATLHYSRACLHMFKLAIKAWYLSGSFPALWHFGMQVSFVLTEMCNLFAWHILSGTFKGPKMFVRTPHTIYCRTEARQK